MDNLGINKFSWIKGTAGVIWLTGLSGSGKSTIAEILSHFFAAQLIPHEHLDGDTIRNIFPQTGFSKEDRDMHVRRVGYIASLLEKHGVTVIASLISPLQESRNRVKMQCRNFFQIYLNTPLEICEQRDPKGLYKKVRKGELLNFTGISSPYEVPLDADLVIDTTAIPPEECVKIITHEYIKFIQKKALIHTIQKEPLLK